MRRSAAALALALLLPLPGLAGEVVVKPGETLSEIAERYGTTVQRLMQLNNLQTPQDLWAGSRIQVPGASTPSRTTGTRPPVNRNAREHRVQPGETLSEIASLYGIPMSRLVALNGLSQPNNVQAGTTLKLRGSAPTSNGTASRPTGPPPPEQPAQRPPRRRGQRPAPPRLPPQPQRRAQPQLPPARRDRPPRQPDPAPHRPAP